MKHFQYTCLLLSSAALTHSEAQNISATSVAASITSTRSISSPISLTKKNRVILRCNGPVEDAIEELKLKDWEILKRGDRRLVVEIRHRKLEEAYQSEYISEVITDRVFSIDSVEGSETKSWALDRIDQRSGRDGNYEFTHTGAGVDVFVLDTGIRTSHEEFGGRADAPFSAYNDNGADNNGHGTHCAGLSSSTNYGVAPASNVHGIKVLSDDGSGYLSDIVSGIEWVRKNHQGAAVLNISLGATGIYTELNEAVRSAILQDGLHVAVAAGNESADAATNSPAAVKEAVTVGASSNNDDMASFSNYGSVIDILAPGTGITSLGHSSDTGTSVLTGTSMSTPLVAGVIALYLEANSGLNPSDLTDSLISNATQDILSNLSGETPNRLIYSLIERDPQPEDPAGDSQPEDPAGDPQPEDPAGDPQPEDPAGDPQPEDPASDPQPEDPASDPQPEDPAYLVEENYTKSARFWRPRSIIAYADRLGANTGTLSSAQNGDMDLFLQKNIGRRKWIIVDASYGPTSDEEIVYTVEDGNRYKWWATTNKWHQRFDFSLTYPLQGEFSEIE